MKKQMKAYIAEADRLGCRTTITKTKHYKIVMTHSNTGKSRYVVVSASPSDHRSFMNARALIRRTASMLAA